MIKKINKVNEKKHLIYLIDEIASLKKTGISEAEKKYVSSEHKHKKRMFFPFNRLENIAFIQVLNITGDQTASLESCRKDGDAFQQILQMHQLEDIQLIDLTADPAYALAFAEGMVLGHYKYKKFKSKKEDKPQTALKQLMIYSGKVKSSDIERLNITCEAVCMCRDLVNEPNNFQDAKQLSASFQAMGKDAGVSVKVLDKKQIESLRMGGLLAVNKGSVVPPTFTVMEWKPKALKHPKTIVLIGKGLVFDAGGMNIKTGGYMSDMKQDMAGAATMASVICALARLNAPLHVIALLPATDNRLNGLAMVPGDVITMHDGTTVEIDNTDAEGRLILADAMSYGQQYKPTLIIDAATLTGAASRAIGKYGIVAMHQDAEKDMDALKRSGFATYERIAEFPFWAEYKDLLKSEIADMKNSGGAVEAGMISAGKFIAHFTKYPYIHLDIAGVAFMNTKYAYHGIGGTGFGVRLLVDFLMKYGK